MTLLFGLFLVGHGLVHGMYLVPRPPDAGTNWPFDPSESWLLTRLGAEPDLARAVAAVLVAVTLGAFIAAAVAAIGVLPADWLRPCAAVAAVASLVLLGVFFHPWLVVGVAIDAVILGLVSIAAWRPA